MDLLDICHNASAILLSSQSSWLNSDYLTVIVDKPDLSLFSKNAKLYLTDNVDVVGETQKNPFDIIEHYQDKGYYALGYIGYDYLEFCDINLKLGLKEYDNRYPQLYINFYKQDKLISFERGQVENINEIKLKKYSGKSSSEIYYSISKKTYISNVNKIKKYIEAGDVYQVNLSHLVRSEIKEDPKNIFLQYFSSQPVPYGIYINCDKFHFLGGSMELFVEKKGGSVKTKPIKGTSKRHNDSKLDYKRKIELKASLKERAENLMIVDLMRNDFSRICKNGTIRVNKLFDVKSYQTLHQMESEVRGELKEDTKLKDIIYNIFPPGSVTGAPKKRSIEIIDELERHSRGPYCGCAGVFTPDGDFTLCVSIRTAIISENLANYWAGSGIVYDSDPNKEYEETLLKAGAFLNSIN
jgi:anthranilate/para-aminobenzoate synthase component I